MTGRTCTFLLSSLAATLFLVMSAWPHRPLLVWNATPSSPVGLYLVRGPTRLRIGRTVVAWAPAPARKLADVRRYVPANVPLVKSIAAVEGSRVCASGKTISIDGHVVALRLARDASGRKMPWWSGCRTLKSGDIFLLSAREPRAFDGRYFGITHRDEVVGEAVLL